MGQYDTGKAQQKIIAVLARMVVLPPEMIKADVRYQDMLNTDPGAIRDFSLQVEKTLGVDGRIGLYRNCARHFNLKR